MITQEQRIVRSIEILRAVLRDVDERLEQTEAAIHLQWAIDLLAEAHKIGRLPRPNF